MTVNQVAIARDYQDGFTSAKIFAQYGMSRASFTGQYTIDSPKRLVNRQVIQEYLQDTVLKGAFGRRGSNHRRYHPRRPVYSHSR